MPGTGLGRLGPHQHQIVSGDTDGGSTIADSTATLDLDAGETSPSVFTNTQRGRIIVEKQTVPDGS